MGTLTGTMQGHETRLCDDIANLQGAVQKLRVLARGIRQELTGLPAAEQASPQAPRGGTVQQRLADTISDSDHAYTDLRAIEVELGAPEPPGGGCVGD